MVTNVHKIDRWIAVREQIESEELKDCSFQPSLYKPPKQVVPLYRGESCEDSTLFYLLITYNIIDEHCPLGFSSPLSDKKSTKTLGDKAPTPLYTGDCTESTQSSLSLSPQSLSTSSVSTVHMSNTGLRDRKFNGRKNSWRGALTTGWMSKE